MKNIILKNKFSFKIKNNLVLKYYNNSRYFTEYLSLFRNSMKKYNYDAYIILNSDPHKNEYLAEKDKIIKKISKFSGTNAVVLITKDLSYIWTDSRYYLQAEKELDKNWKMIPLENSDMEIKKFVSDNFSQKNYNFKIALNFRQSSINIITSFKEYLKDKQFEIIDDENKVIQEIFPEVQKNIQSTKEEIFVHQLRYSGLTSLFKYDIVRHKISKILKIDNNHKSNFALILNKLDDITWISNLRTNILDIPNNPTFLAYALLLLTKNSERLILYVKENKTLKIPKEYLNENKIELKSYDDFYSDIFSLNNLLFASEYEILIDRNSCNYSIYEKILNSGMKHKLLDLNIIEHCKCIKNETEIQGIRDCHKRDGAAIVRYLAWLDNELNLNKSVSEYEGAIKLLNYRKENNLFLGESFDTISSSGSNSAIIHYKPEENICQKIDKSKIYLLDSGAHYLDGTTDTTRTVHFGEPTYFEKEIYTRILLGNLSVEKLLIDSKTSGSQIDCIARQYLWQIGSDYGHGTGHGVGHCSSVHEGPQSISSRSNVAFKQGMVTSNEPGYYIKNQFGVRIENILICQQHTIMKNKLLFENVTRVNYETNLIDKNLVSPDMIQQINIYNDTVYRDLYPYLKELDDYLAINYLKKKTFAI
jgi:Xaa-Pro aminopeptidase